MPKFFTHYWKATEILPERIGLPIVHAASNLFEERGVSAGDFLYVVTRQTGHLALLGRLEINKVTGSSIEVQKAVGYRPRDAARHVIAKISSGTPLTLDMIVPQ